MDDEWVVLSEVVAEGSTQAAIPGAFWVEFFPPLKYIPSWVPGTTFWKHIHTHLPHIIRLRDEPFATVQASVVSLLFDRNHDSSSLTLIQDNGTAKSSLTQILIEDIRAKYGGTPKEVEQTEIARNITAVAYNGEFLFTTIRVSLM